MKNLLVLLALCSFSSILLAQYDYEFKTLPYGNGILSTKESLVEVGPEFNWNLTTKGKTFFIRPTLRMPISNANETSVQIDRFSPKWRFVLASQYGQINGYQCTVINGYSLGIQLEFGYNNFSYYELPQDIKPQDAYSMSYAGEIKLIRFFSRKDYKASQYSPQFRFRYARTMLGNDEVGIVNPADAQGVQTTTNKAIGNPFAATVFSPAFAYLMYSGRGNFVYAPAVYYDFYTKTDALSGASGRLRVEYNVFFYPIIRESNMKIGLTPFVSLRTNGTDRFDRFVFGGQVSLRFGTAFLQFF